MFQTCCLSVRPLLLFSFLLMVAAGVMIPSDGNHGILNIKSLAFVLTALSLAAYGYTQQKTSLGSLNILLVFLLALAFLTLWSLVSLINGATALESLLDQFKVFLVTLCATLFSYYLVSEKLLSFATFVKTILYANFAYSSLKVALVLMHLVGLLDLFDLMEATGMRFMSMDMGTGMIRMQTSIDILTPFLIFYVLKAQTLGIALNARFRSAYLLISAFAIFLSFSRVLMAEGLASLLLFWFTLKPAQMVRSMLFFSVIACALVAAIGPSTIATMAGQRFLSDVNQGSDDTRVEQIEALVKEHQSYPFFGKGLGGYSSDLVRDEKLRHSYEVQWIAFLMQFGLLGLVMIGSALGSIGWLYLQKRPSRLQLAFLALFCCWILAGFTNPYLISLTSGLVYALFLLTGLQLREKTE
jgi:hypothetical protein